MAEGITAVNKIIVNGSLCLAETLVRCFTTNSQPQHINCIFSDAISNIPKPCPQLSCPRNAAHEVSENILWVGITPAVSHCHRHQRESDKLTVKLVCLSVQYLSLFSKC